MRRSERLILKWDEETEKKPKPKKPDTEENEKKVKIPQKEKSKKSVIKVKIKEPSRSGVEKVTRSGRNFSPYEIYPPIFHRRRDRKPMFKKKRPRPERSEAPRAGEAAAGRDPDDAGGRDAPQAERVEEIEEPEEKREAADEREVHFHNSAMPPYFLNSFPEAYPYPEHWAKMDQEFSRNSPEERLERPDAWSAPEAVVQHPGSLRTMLTDTEKYVFRSCFNDIGKQIANFDRYRGAESSGGDPGKYDVLEAQRSEAKKFYRKKITDSKLMEWHRYNMIASKKYSPVKEEVPPRQVIRVRSSYCHTAELIWRMNRNLRLPAVDDLFPKSPLRIRKIQLKPVNKTAQ